MTNLLLKMLAVIRREFSFIPLMKGSYINLEKPQIKYYHSFTRCNNALVTSKEFKVDTCIVLQVCFVLKRM